MSFAEMFPFANELSAAFHVQREAERHEPDAIDRIVDVIDVACDAGASKREAVCRALEQIRAELAPVIRSPRGYKDRPASRKARRRVIGPIDHLIAQGRTRDG